MKKLRKFLVVSVMVLSVMAMSGLNAPTASAAASAGDLIKMEGLSSVYYLGDDGKRYVFPNEATFFSWYADFSSVVTISATELQSYPLGGNVTMRPGTTLVKITTDPSVYAVEPNGVLRKIQSEAQAAALYGTNWNRRIVDLADAFFTNYTVGAPLADGEIPVGSLVKNAGNPAVFYYDGTNYRAIASEAAMAANRLWMRHVMTVTNTLVAGGNPLTGMEAGLVRVNQGSSTGPVVTGSGLMVSLSSQTPAAMNVPGNVSVDVLKINLTAANDGPVNVSALTFTAHGLSNAENIDAVTVFDNGVRVGASRNVNSSREATINFPTPIFIAAGATKTLSVKATIADISGSYGLGIASASHIISSAATVSGSFPLRGNLMSAINATVGQITIEDAPVTSSASFGEDNVLLADFTLRASNDEDALVQSISLYNGGTNDNNIVSNLVLIIDGVQVATGSYLNRYAIFTLNNYEIKKGDTVSVEVRGDMGTTSSDDTVRLYLKDNVDFIAVGKTHGFGLRLINNFNTVNSIITLTAGDFTIDMDKAAAPARDVKPGDDNVVLATLKMTSNGENATLSRINAANFFITLNTGTTTVLLENVEMRDVATGGIYDLAVATTTTPHDKYTLGLSDEITLAKGVTKTFQIRADIKDTANVGQTFRVTLEGAGMNIEGNVSGADINNITPSSVTGSIITVKDATLELTPTTLVNTSVVGGAKDVVVYQARVKAGTADGVTIQSVRLSSATSTATNSAFTDNNITKLSLWLNGKLLREVSNQISNDSLTTNGVITFNSLNAANRTVPAGAEYDLVVRADFASTVTAGDFRLRVNAASDMSVRSVTGSNIVAPIVISGNSRLVTTATAGTLNVSLLTTDSRSNRDSFLLAGSETEVARNLGEIRFVTTNEAIRVETLTLTAATGQTATATNADLSSVKLVRADGTVVASRSVNANGNVVFDPFNVVFEADKSTSLYIVAVARGINVNNDPTSTATAGRSVQFTLGAVTATGNSSNATTVVVNSAGTSRIATIVGSRLNSITNAMTDGKLANGTNRTIARYTFVFENGSNREANNDELKAVLTGLRMNFGKSTSTTLANIRIAIDGTTNFAAASTTAATSTILAPGAANGVAVWEISELANLLDAARMDGSVTLVVTADVSGVVERSWLESALNVLAGNIIYRSNNVTHDAFGRLPVTEIKGAYLAD